MSTSLSIVIPTCGREGVLVDTIGSLLALSNPADELLVIDQSPRHEPETEAALSRWDAKGAIRWTRQQPPSLVRALNRGLLDARGDIVLILDDDIIPSPELVAAHAAAYAAHPRAWAVVGQVLQPGETPETPTCATRRPGLGASLDFPFRSTQGAWIANAIACNLSVRRNRALAVGGFDERFLPPVSYRFETEFARRMIAHGGAIRFEPHASVRHLRAGAGGTRQRGGHLASASPLHGCGDYYFALRCGRGWDRAAYMARRPFREVCTRFHLRHPWWIPVKFIGELRALGMAVSLYRQGPRLLQPPATMTDSCFSGSGAAALPQPETGAGSRAAPWA